MGKQQQEEKKNQQQSKSLRSKAAHFVSDLTTVLLNPISDKPSKPISEGHHVESDLEDDSGDSVDGPDTSSFSAFLISLLGTTESQSNSKSNEEDESGQSELKSSESTMIENGRRKSLFSRGKQSLGRAFYQAAKLGGFRQAPKSSSDIAVDDDNESNSSREQGIPMQTLNEPLLRDDLPEISEPSLLLSERTRGVLYAALPVVVQNRKWVLVYSTWRHGISLSTLYRRSMLCPGLSLLVVGDRTGAIFGGLVEAPLKATSKRRYQGTSNSFVFTNISGHPLIYRPTGLNRYFTLCSPEYLALGGGGHFALYLDGDLLSGSSSSSETYGNPCLARAEDFDVKEIELWGFVYASKYEEMVSSLRTEAPGICHF